MLLEMAASLYHSVAWAVSMCCVQRVGGKEKGKGRREERICP